MQDVAGGGNGVAGVEEVTPGEPGGGEEPEGGSLIAGDVAVEPGLQLGAGNVVVRGEHFRGFAVVVAGTKGATVGLRDGGDFAELFVDPADGGFQRPAVHPVHEAEGEHVLAAVDLDGGEAEGAIFQRAGVEFGDGRTVEAVGFEGAVLQGVGCVGGLAQVNLRELILIDDEDATGGEVAQVCLEGGRVHGHQNIGLITGGIDLLAGEADLEAADAGEGALGSADFRGKIGEGADVVAGDGGGVGELGAGKLHAITGVTRKPDRYAFEFLNRVLLATFALCGPFCCCRHYAPSGFSIFWSGRGGRLRT